MKKDDGGLAFPGFHIDNGTTTVYGGMTLRQWYAGMAMQGILANQDERNVQRGGRGTGMGTSRDVATYAFVVADAMIAAEKNEEV